MITGLKYTNGEGRTFDFDRHGVHPSFSEAFDWELSVRELNGSVASFGRGPREIPITVTLSGSEARASYMDELYEVCAADVAANREGRLSVGEWGITCALVKSAKSLWWRGCGPVPYDLVFRSQVPFWTRESLYRVLPPQDLGEGLDYPHDCRFDYCSPAQVASVVSDGAYPSDFRLVIYGPVSDPSISIGPNTYSVSVDVPDGAHIAVDSSAATVELVGANGDRANVFDKTPDAPPGSGRYIFEQIPPGRREITWEGGFGFDITVLERRDERLWS